MTSSEQPPCRDINAAEAQELVAAGKVQVLDVRSPAEFTQLGHIPGASLLPVDLVAAGPASIVRDERPLLITCEHGVRSAHAARFLMQAGFTNLLNMAGGMATWTGPRQHEPASHEQFLGPSSWLLANSDLLPRGGRALDVACGRGRHALLLASAGYQVDAVDRDPARLETLQQAATRLSLPVTVHHRDLESADPVDLGQELYDLIVVVRYLHRPLFPALRAALKPEGLLLYETFTVHQAAQGHPANPDFLLQSEELEQLVAPLEILRQREGETGGQYLAAVAARRTLSGA